MVLQTEVSSEGQDIVNILMNNILNEVLRIIGQQTNLHSSHECCYDSFQDIKLQTYEIDNVLENMMKKTGSIEKNKEIENTENCSINSNLSEIIFPSLPDLCCSLSTTSKQGEGDYQHNTIREAAAFYQLGQYHRAPSNSSMITEISNSDIAESLKDKINNLSFDTIQLSDNEGDTSIPKSLPSCLDPNKLLTIPGQVISEVDVRDDEKSDSFLQKSQKFCQYNNKQYLPLNADSSTNYSPLINEECDDDSDIQDLEEEKELISESSNELVNVEGDSEEKWIPVKHFVQTNPLISSTTDSSLHLPSPCFPDNISIDSENDVSTTTVVADIEPVKELSNWEEEVEVQINVTEPLKNELQNVSANCDFVKSKTYLSSVGVMKEYQVDPKYLGEVDVPGMESIPGVRRVEVKYSTKEPEDEIWVLEHGTDDEEEPSLSDKDISTNAHINYLSFAEKANKEKKKRKFISRLASGIMNLLRSKKNINKKL